MKSAESIDTMGESAEVVAHLTDPSNSLYRRPSVPIEDSSTRLIPLTKGLGATVDVADYEFLMQWKWRAHWGGRGYYAYRKDPRREFVLMHRVIMGCVRGDGKKVDHRDHDCLNNRRSNLRVCTEQQNQMNSPKVQRYSSRFKGVHWNKASGKWRAKLCKTILGYFSEEEAAARAYDKAAFDRFGDFAFLNFKH